MNSYILSFIHHVVANYIIAYLQLINMPSLKTLLASAAMAYLATAKTIKITATSDNKFDPETVEAEKDDVIEFHFEPKNHSVVAGDYRYPCSPLDLGSGFFSGFLPTDSGSAVSSNIS